MSCTISMVIRRSIEKLCGTCSLKLPMHWICTNHESIITSISYIVILAIEYNEKCQINKKASIQVTKTIQRQIRRRDRWQIEYINTNMLQTAPEASGCVTDQRIVKSTNLNNFFQSNTNCSCSCYFNYFSMIIRICLLQKGFSMQWDKSTSQAIATWTQSHADRKSSFRASAFLSFLR